MTNRAAKILMLIVGQLFLASMLLAITGDNNNLFIKSLHIPDNVFIHLMHWGQINLLFVFGCLTLLVILFWLVIVPYWIDGWLRKHK
ncbi:hypothetical protein [Legionella rowbothamii]|uniref:hypothetical protein n=1 Tax=Legionella rowbothamii TaxID=96229 RepID=UPI0010559A1B|nr:hypothetical protein [Legionella rowbothamii]